MSVPASQFLRRVLVARSCARLLLTAATARNLCQCERKPAIATVVSLYVDATSPFRSNMDCNDTTVEAMKVYVAPATLFHHLL